MTSRYFRLRAEQVSTTPCEPDDRRLNDSSRRRVSQSQRSASVRGMPFDIFSILAGGWNCGVLASITSDIEIYISLPRLLRCRVGS